MCLKEVREGRITKSEIQPIREKTEKEIEKTKKEIKDEKEYFNVRKQPDIYSEYLRLSSHQCIVYFRIIFRGPVTRNGCVKNYASLKQREVEFVERICKIIFGHNIKSFPALTSLKRFPVSHVSDKCASNCALHRGPGGKVSYSFHDLCIRAKYSFLGSLVTADGSES